MVAGNRSKLESGKPRKADARSSPPKGGVGYRDRALLRLIREEYNGQTSAGLEKDRSKDKETWGGKLEAKAEPAPTGLMAKAAAAVSSAVVRLLTSQVCSHLLFQRRLTSDCGQGAPKPKAGGSPKSPRKKKKAAAAAGKASMPKTAAPATAAPATAAKKPAPAQRPQAQRQLAPRGGWWQRGWARKCGGVAAVLVLVAVLLRRR